MSFSNTLRGIIPQERGVRFGFFLFIFSLLFLFLYSFTQMDLSLTITRTSFWQPIQHFFQYIGYFNRPLSSALYLLLLAFLFGGYLMLFRYALAGKLTSRTVWFLVLLSAGLLLFAYNAFSYDLFNYIFDAKIITHYHENPYLRKALDYPGDPMLSFMHWTHRTYPYGPSWLIFTVPLSFIGVNYFLPTLFLFKVAIAACYVGSAYTIYSLSRKIHKAEGVVPLVFFALNPLVLIESLVSAHNDIVMLFFALLALLWLFEKKSVLSLASLVFSIGVKFATGLLLPVYAYLFLRIRRGKTVSWEKIFLVMSILMLGAMILATWRTNFQPWYFLYALPFLSFSSRKHFISYSGIVFSFGSLLQYLPYFYTGNYDPPIPSVLFEIFLASSLLSLLLAGSLRLLGPRSNIPA